MKDPVDLGRLPVGLPSPGVLLRTADAVMRSRWPQLQAYFKQDGVALRARFDYPGILCVHTNNTGEQLAESLPGCPTTPAPRSQWRCPGASE